MSSLMVDYFNRVGLDVNPQKGSAPKEYKPDGGENRGPATLFGDLFNSIHRVGFDSTAFKACLNMLPENWKRRARRDNTKDRRPAWMGDLRNPPEPESDTSASTFRVLG